MVHCVSSSTAWPPGTLASSSPFALQAKGPRFVRPLARSGQPRYLLGQLEHAAGRGRTTDRRKEGRAGGRAGQRNSQRIHFAKERKNERAELFAPRSRPRRNFPPLSFVPKIVRGSVTKYEIEISSVGRSEIWRRKKERGGRDEMVLCCRHNLSVTTRR